MSKQKMVWLKNVDKQTDMVCRRIDKRPRFKERNSPLSVDKFKSQRSESLV